MVLAGDSYFAQGDVGVSGGLRLSATNIGDAVLGQALSPRFNSFTWADAADARFFTGDNYGVGGDTTQELLDRIDTVLERNPAVVALRIGQNDVIAGTAASTSAANINAIVEALFDGGVQRIALGNVTPVTSTYATPNNAIRNELNRLIADIARTDARIAHVDLYSALVQGNGFALAADLNVDGLHLGPKGALKLAAVWKDAFNCLFSDKNVFEVLWAQTNLLGTRGTLQGSGGTLTAGVTGSLAAAHVGTRSTAGTSSVVGSLQANTTYNASGQTQILTVTPGGSGTNESVTFGSNPNAITTAVANQWAMAWAEVEVDDWAFWNGISIKLGYAPFNANRFVQGQTYQTVTVPIGPRTIYIATPPYLLDGNATGIMPSIIAGFSANGATGTGVLKIKRWWAGIITDPSVIP